MDRRIILIIFASLCSCYSATAQELNIKTEVDSFMYGDCDKTVDFQILLEDVELSANLLSKYKSDTLKCYESKVCETICKLFHQSNNKYLASTIIAYTLDTNNYYCGYLINCIYDRIHLIQLSEDDLQKLNNPLLCKCDSRNVPLLISYLNIKEMIPTLRQWGVVNQLSDFNKDILSVSLARLGVEEEIDNLINKIIYTDSEWLIYFDYLNFIRNPKTTELLISYLSDDTEIILEEIPDAYMIIKCKLSALALYHLSMYVEDFPYKIGYFDLHDDVSDKVKAAQDWFEENKDFQFTTELGSFKL